jgi:hypothetical protein
MLWIIRVASRLKVISPHTSHCSAGIPLIVSGCLPAQFVFTLVVMFFTAPPHTKHSFILINSSNDFAVAKLPAQHPKTLPVYDKPTQLNIQAAANSDHIETNTARLLKQHPNVLGIRRRQLDFDLMSIQDGANYFIRHYFSLIHPLQSMHGKSDIPLQSA